MNHLLGRWFTWNVKTCFLWKIKKKFFRMSSAINFAWRFKSWVTLLAKIFFVKSIYALCIYIKQSLTLNLLSVTTRKRGFAKSISKWNGSLQLFLWNLHCHFFNQLFANLFWIFVQYPILGPCIYSDLTAYLTFPNIWTGLSDYLGIQAEWLTVHRTLNSCSYEQFDLGLHCLGITSNTG